MTEKQIVDEIIRYIDDTFYSYAVMLTGEWGIGKTFFAENSLKKAIIEHEKSGNGRRVEYISLYGCKKADDISRRFVWALTHGAFEERGLNLLGASLLKEHQKLKDKSVNIIKRLGTEITHKFTSDETLFDFAYELMNVEDYIFIIDDLERCGCEINEIFGILNRLVEHRNAKVIILANESEIKDHTHIEFNKEIQYYYSLQNNIRWPDKNGVYSLPRYGVDNDKIPLEELERRRKLMFPEVNNNQEYLSIKEKLVGVTLEYRPSIEKTLIEVMTHSALDDDVKQDLLSSMDNYIMIMDNYRHHNMRTFLFFLSKIKFLLDELNRISIDSYYLPDVKRKIETDAFLCAVRYKCDYEPQSDSYVSTLTESSNEPSRAVFEYVNTGFFDIDSYREDINTIVDGLKNKLSDNDPLELLYHQYYYHTEMWCNNEVDELLLNLQNDRYKIRVYGRIVIILLRLEKLGFSNEHLVNAKKLMVKNIMNSDEINQKIDDDLFYIEDADFRSSVKAVIDDLNVAILSQSQKNRSETISEILKRVAWVEKLQKYSNPDNYRYYSDEPVFCLATAEEWYAAIHKASPRDIDLFRQWLSKVYPRNIKRQSFGHDEGVLTELYNLLDKDKETDLIKSASIGWLKSQIMHVIEDNSDNLAENN